MQANTISITRSLNLHAAPIDLVHSWVPPGDIFFILPFFKVLSFFGDILPAL